MGEGGDGLWNRFRHTHGLDEAARSTVSSMQRVGKVSNFGGMIMKLLGLRNANEVKDKAAKGMARLLPRLRIKVVY